MSSKMSGERDDKLRLIQCLCSKLKSMGLCSSDEEANAVAETLADHEPFEDSSDYLDMVVDSFRDYYGDENLSYSYIKSSVGAAAIECWGSSSRISSYYTNIDESNEDSTTHANQDDEDEASYQDSDDDGEFIGEGECELCERTIKLTRHHLIPKSTWPRIKKRLFHAASQIESYHSETDSVKQSNLRDKLQKSIGIRNPKDLPVTISHASIRIYLSNVSFLCRPCHSAVHRIHDEWQLATDFNTIELLLGSDEVRKFAKWANKQRPGKYALK